MAITTQDLIRFGLITDPKAYLESESKKWNEYYDDLIERAKSDLAAATSDTQYQLRSARLESTYQRKEQRFEAIDKRYTELVDRMYEALDRPGIVATARSKIEQEVAQQREELRQKTEREKEQFRVESEGIQRGTAERESARIRSRRAGGGGGRGMLAGYSLSIPQAVGGRSTLGRPVQSGGAVGTQSAMTLGRSLLG